MKQHSIRTYYIKTFGCQMNKNDSSIIARILDDAAYGPAAQLETADILVINTCSVRAHAEQRALGYIAGLRRWRAREGRILAVVGCMAKRLADDIARTYPFVDLILGPDSYRHMGTFIDELLVKHGTRIIETLAHEEMYCGIYPATRGVTDFVSVMRGCDNYCSYCVVPFLRGPARSRPVDDIMEEMKILVSRGVRDITLLGQNVNEYSHNGIRFAELLNTVAAIPGLLRLRFLTSHPKDLTDDIIGAVKETSTICEWFHLPLQSASNRVLALMNRTYTKEYFLRLVDKIRKEIPEATITTDVIVGFPTETEGEYLETIAVMNEVGFDDAYMYRYSPRTGTKAYEYPSVPEEVIRKRLEHLIQVQNSIAMMKTNEMLGKTFSVLFEAEAKDGATRGKTRGNKDVIVQCRVPLGEVYDVVITEIRGKTPIGEILGGDREGKKGA